MALTKKLEAIGDSIRSKTGTTEKMTLDTMASTINKDLVLAADNDPKTLLDKFIKDELTEYENDELTKAPDYGFYNKGNIEKISLPNAAEVGSYAFANTNKLESLTLGKVNKVNSSSFGNTTRWNKDAIGIWEFPYLLSGSINAFDYSGFKGLGLPNFNSIDGYGSTSHSNIEFLYLSDNYGTLGGTSSYYALMNYSKAKGFILDAVAPPTLNYLVGQSHTSSSNPFYTGKAKIYVPRERLEAYSTATNWSVYYEAGNIVAIEDNQNILEGMFPSLDAKYFDPFDWENATLQEKFDKVINNEFWLLNTKLTYEDIANVAADLETNTTSSVYYKYKDALLGRKMSVEIGGVSCTATIIGILQDVDENDNPLAFTYWITKDKVLFDSATWTKLHYTTYKMNDSNPNDGGWGATEMRRWLNEEQYPTLSCAEFVKPAKKYYGATYDTTPTDVSSIMDKLFLLSSFELQGSPHINASKPFWWYEGVGANHNEQYQLFAKEGITYTNHNNLRCHTEWWLRTCNYWTDVGFMGVNTYGNLTAYDSYKVLGIVPCFCI